MIVHTYINKGSDDAEDFEGNYKDQATEIDAVVIGSGTVTFLKKVSYADFKGYIDGETIKWSDVYYKDYENFYELFLEGV